MARMPIKDFPGYEIDTDGVVYSLPKLRRRGIRALKPYKDTGGYLIIMLRDGKKGHTKKIHRLVGETFIRNPEGHPWVLHRDGNQLNNKVENLYWGTPVQNAQDSIRHSTFADRKGENAGNHKLTEKQVRVIKHALNFNSEKPMFGFKAILARSFKISQITMSYIASGRLWKHVVV